MAKAKKKRSTTRKPVFKAASARTIRQIEADEKAQQERHREARDKSLLDSINKLGNGKYNLYVTRNSPKGEYLLVESPKLSKCDQAALTQPHFTMLAQDNFTPDLLRAWINAAEQNGTSREKIADARALLKEIEMWRTNNPLRVKTPD